MVRVEVPLEHLFDPITSIWLRKWIVSITQDNKIKFKDNPKNNQKESNYCVINPIDYCSVGCKHCLYSAKLTNKRECPKISLKDSKKLSKILTEANMKQIVFSGGGEPLENLKTVLYLMNNVSTLEEVVIITSAFFAKTKRVTEEILNKILNIAKKKEISLILRISRDNAQQANVPLEYIKNIIDFKKKDKKYCSLFSIIFRTLIGEDQNQDKLISELCSLEIHPIRRFPIIDGLPVKWFIDKGLKLEIPVIYKPLYFTGRAKKIQGKSYSLWKIVRDEEKSGGLFNLSIRGPRGQGHNYYGELLKGYSSWRRKGSPLNLSSPFKKEDKSLALYITADSTLILNDGVLDNFFHIKNLADWKSFISYQYSDILQRAVIFKGPLFIMSIIEEVDKNLKKKIEKQNFVFLINSLSLETPQKRLYLTLRLLEEGLKEGRLVIKNSQLYNLVIRGKDYFKKLYHEAESWDFSYPLRKKRSPLDPIKGDELSIIPKENIFYASKSPEEFLSSLSE